VLTLHTTTITRTTTTHKPQPATQLIAYNTTNSPQHTTQPTAKHTKQPTTQHRTQDSTQQNPPKTIHISQHNTTHNAPQPTAYHTIQFTTHGQEGGEGGRTGLRGKGGRRTRGDRGRRSHHDYVRRPRRDGMVHHPPADEPCRWKSLFQSSQCDTAVEIKQSLIYICHPKWKWQTTIVNLVYYTYLYTYYNQFAVLYVYMYIYYKYIP
jgi:hypothetical protein